MRVAVCTIVVAAVLPVAALAIPMGAYGNTARFDRLTGQKTQSGLVFLGWDQGRSWGSPYSYFLNNLRERPHIALHPEGRGGMLTPSAIALGKGDAHLIGLALAIAESAKPALIRPLAEMNNSKNPYCAFTPSGGRRGAAYSTRWYKRAFQRIYILMHGGTAQAMTARLRALGMPGVRTDVPVNRYPNLTVIWNPLAVGVPDVRGNQYRDYFPGSRYVERQQLLQHERRLRLPPDRGAEQGLSGEAVHVPGVGLEHRQPGVHPGVRDVPPQAQARPLRELLQRAGGRCVRPRHQAESLAAYRRSIVPLSR
jgi:hypothetical protein